VHSGWNYLQHEISLEVVPVSVPCRYVLHDTVRMHVSLWALWTPALMLVAIFVVVSGLPASMISQAFKFFDRDGNGYITLDELEVSLMGCHHIE
jgi:hypothetical protein